MLALASFSKFVAGAAGNDIAAMVNEEANEFEQAHLARLAADDGEQDHAERFLHLGVLEKIVEDELRLFAALQLDDDAHAFAVAFVANVGDAFDLFVGDKLGDAFDELGFVDLVRNFRNDDVFAVFADFFDGRLGAHGETAAAALVGLLDAFAACDEAAGGQIRAGDILHCFLERELRLFDHGDRGVNHFAQVVRRNVGGHANRDTAGAIDKKIRNARGEDRGFFFGFVEVRNKIDGFFFNVGEEFLGNFGEARFGVPHCRGHVAVHGAEVALAIDERVAHVEVLRHADERIVDRRVAVRVIFAEDFADDLGALAVGLGGGEAEFVHAEENAAMNGFEAVADVGERAPDDYAHGVIEIGLAHFGFDVYRKQDGLVLFVGHVSSVSSLAFVAPGFRPGMPSGRMALHKNLIGALAQARRPSRCRRRRRRW